MYKEKFISEIYNKIKDAINGIDNKVANDIYAISFWNTNEEDDQRYPQIIVSYNTNSHYESQINKASSAGEAKWNFVFWLHNDLLIIGGSDDKNLAGWFKETPFYYSDKQEELAEDDDELFDELLERGSEFHNLFIDEIISIAKKLHNEVISNKFGRPIPIIIHELEYYDVPIGWTKEANSPELIADFLEYYN